MYLHDIKRIDLACIDLDEAITALAFARAIQAEYQHQEMPSPVWLDERVVQLDREVKEQKRDNLLRSLAQAKVKRESLKTRDQRLSDVNENLAALEAAIAKL